MRILLTNDDGVRAPGLVALRDEMAALGEVIVVAPATERSGASHSITVAGPLEVSGPRRDERFCEYVVKGEPVDCVMIALRELLTGAPDLVVSGVNLGLNVGINVLYSGTVGAAVEALMRGIPAIAVSLEWSEHPDFSYATGLTRRLAAKVVGRKRWHSVFNVNVPALPEAEILGCKLAHQSCVRWHERFNREGAGDPQRYTLGRRPGHDEPEAGSDLAAVRAGYVAITPLRFDMTDRRLMEQLRGEGI